MASLHDQLRGLVYSTEHGDICPDCRHAVAECRCVELAEQERIAALDGIVRIRRETSGRKGKGVTTISGIPLSQAELQALARHSRSYAEPVAQYRQGSSRSRVTTVNACKASSNVEVIASNLRAVKLNCMRALE